MAPRTMTRAEYDSLPADYRGLVEGVPYALYMDNGGRTVYGPVTITDADPAPGALPCNHCNE